MNKVRSVFKGTCCCSLTLFKKSLSEAGPGAIWQDSSVPKSTQEPEGVLAHRARGASRGAQRQAEEQLEGVGRGSCSQPPLCVLHKRDILMNIF